MRDQPHYFLPKQHGLKILAPILAFVQIAQSGLAGLLKKYIEVHISDGQVSMVMQINDYGGA
ncbi:hypothetical protein [Kushneria sp. TE3]|uniref:hypothetical protein n=1 Tax=Kushneria sp. TE3 TaxID=3449832 RepID=UPI003F688426